MRPTDDQNASGNVKRPRAEALVDKADAMSLERLLSEKAGGEHSLNCSASSVYVESCKVHL